MHNSTTADALFNLQRKVTSWAHISIEWVFFASPVIVEVAGSIATALSSGPLVDKYW